MEVTRDTHDKEFAYTCPNEDCEEGWKSPKAQMWKRSKAEAASEWDYSNSRLVQNTMPTL